MEERVLDFISRRFPNESNWMNGNCFFFAQILKARFHGDIVYDPIDGHFLLLAPDGQFYDWTGKREYDENYAQNLKAGIDSIKTFNNLFGEYPYDTYSVIASDFYIGGMEYPTLVMIDQSLYNEKDKFLLEYVIAHETAHQWWYSVIGNDEISEPWLDEALTEYSTILYFEIFVF